MSIETVCGTITRICRTDTRHALVTAQQLEAFRALLISARSGVDS